MNWTEYLFRFAEHAARKSKDSTQVGAIFARDNFVLCAGFNGPPRGVKDLPERFERPAKYLFATHAEQNLVATAAREGIKVEGCDVYVTHAPCSTCARLLIQAGVRRIFFGNGKTSMPAEEFTAAAMMFEEAEIEVFCVHDN